MLKDIKYRGINTASNGYDATAGQLAVAHNVINEVGYIEPLASPKEVVNFNNHSVSDCKCLFKHEMLSGTTNYIFYMPGGDFNNDFNNDYRTNTVSTLVYLSKSHAENPSDHTAASEVTWMDDSPVQASIAEDPANLFQITAVGNTLCVLTAAGMDYFVWKNNGYQELGTRIPNVDAQFALKHHRANSSLVNMGSSSAIIDENQQTGHSRNINIDSTLVSAWTNAIYGEINVLAADARRDGYIADPFFIRYAVRLFDGTLVNHSAPVLMSPSLISQVEPWVGLCLENVAGAIWGFQKFMVYYISGELQAKISSPDLSDWADVVTGVELYITNPKSRRDESQDITKVWFVGSVGGTGGMDDHKYSAYELTTDAGYAIGSISELYPGTDPRDPELYQHHAILPVNSNEGFETDGVFYKIKEMTIAELDDYSSDFAPIDLGRVLETLTTRTAMVDDYNSHNTLIPNGAYVYNQRINLFDVSRWVTFDQALNSFLQYFSSGPNDTATAYVRLEVEGQEKWIKSTTQPLSYGSMTNIRYFFFPDTHAKEILIYSDSTHAWSLTLKEHTSLNGAYWYDDGDVAEVESVSTLPTTTDVVIPEPNKVYTSEVGNPFYFPIGGINTIGTGKIIALASNVRAISLGQFGEFPLYVFTDSGIWMLEVDDKGLYKAKQPMSLDVIESDSKVTSVDNAVAYVIERGLMLVSGSETKCISEDLDGTRETMPTIIGGSGPTVDWSVFKENAVCAYDNVHRRLHVYNPAYRYHYVYSVRTGLWFTMDDTYNLESTINGSLINTSHGLFDVNEEVTGETKTQTLLTRPIFFETDAYKRLRDNIQRGDIDRLRLESGKNVTVLLQGSDDLISWHDIGAVTKHYKIQRKSGTPHKWYRWQLVMVSGMKDYKLNGLTADVDVTGNNKLR